MVGLSVVLENQQRNGKSNIISPKTPQVISKTTMIINSKPPSSSSSSSSSSYFMLSSHTNSQFNYPVPAFLEHCFLCKHKLLPGKDIYMYKGDRAFCSEECRCRQIFMDEEESLKTENCSLAAMKPSTSTSASSSASSSASASSSRHHRKATRNQAGGFAY